MKKVKGIIIALFILFVVLTTLVLMNQTVVFDDTVYNHIMFFRNDNLDSIFKIITKLANTNTILVLIILLSCLLKKKDYHILLTVILSTVGMNQLLKHIIKRVRPDHFRMIVEKGFSFPSGHAMISIALYGYLIYLIYRKTSNKYLKVTLISLFVLLILMIGCSRIYLGVHYPSDVLGGYLLALAILILIINVYQYHLEGGKSNDKNGSK